MRLPTFSLFVIILLAPWFRGTITYGAETLPDGILGMTREEVHLYLGKPTHYYVEEVPYRRHWIFTIEEWDSRRPMFWGDPNIPKDEVLFIQKEDKVLLYRLQYAMDIRQSSPVERVNKYWIYMNKNPVELGELANYIKEFSPAVGPYVHTFRSRHISTNQLYLTMMLQEAYPLASALWYGFKPEMKKYRWTLAYDVGFCEGEGDDITLKSKVCELVVGTNSLENIDKVSQALPIKKTDNPFKK